MHRAGRFEEAFTYFEGLDRTTGELRANRPGGDVGNDRPGMTVRRVLAKPHRVVLVHPGVVARLGAPVLKPLEGRSWVLVGGKAFGTVVAGRARPVERTFAFAPVEADERAI